MIWYYHVVSCPRYCPLPGFHRFKLSVYPYVAIRGSNYVYSVFAPRILILRTFSAEPAAPASLVTSAMAVIMAVL